MPDRKDKALHLGVPHKQGVTSNCPKMANQHPRTNVCVTSAVDLEDAVLDRIDEAQHLELLDSQCVVLNYGANN